MSSTISSRATLFASVAPLGARAVRPVSDALVDDTAPRLLLSGPSGSGKTAILRAAQRLLVERGVPVQALGPGTVVAAVPVATVLLVDDLHALAPDRLAAVLARAEDPDSALVVSSRPWPLTAASSTVARLLERSRPPVVLGQVTRADVLDHLAGSEQIDGGCLDHVLTITGGVTWLVAAALAVHDARDCDADGGHDALDGMLRHHVNHRLAAVDPEVRHAVERAVAEASASDPSSSADGTGPADRDTAIAAGHAEGLLLRDGRCVPAVRDAVRTSPSTPRPLASADFLTRRAGSAWERGDVDAAARLIDEALTAADRTPEIDDRLADLAVATWSMRGMLATGCAFAAALGGGRAGAARGYIARFATGDPGTVTAVERMADAVPSTVAVATGLLRDGLEASLHAEETDAAVAHLVRASHLFSAARSSTALPELPAIIAAAAAAAAGDLATAGAVVDAALDARSGSEWVRSRLLLWRAWVSLQQAHGPQARAALEASLTLTPTPAPRDELMAQAVRIGLARRYDDSAALAEAWENGRSSLIDADVDLFTILPLTEFVCTGARLGDETATRVPFERARALVAGLGSPALWAAHLHWAGIQTGILRNRPESLGPDAHALVEASAASPVAATMAAAGRIWTSVLAGTVDGDEVEAAARGLAAIGLPWDAARLAGQGAGRSDDRRSSARLLACARELHPQDVGREPESDGAVADVVDSGLSEREIDVARLVVQGKTYAEIGEIIFISPRTAEHHIASIRRRLGATSRSDLIAKLRVALGGARLHAGHAS
ncbi:LuxR C-terminal-related transcriptional regulator [Microbacterium sp. CJ88]|uniref:helix-turn-helix transcriptional regulator n=1 Tax=Microbacterium sp. CJ88 TaxID=3445672 RepID=UPI003F65DA19